MSGALERLPHIEPTAAVSRAVSGEPTTTGFYLQTELRKFLVSTRREFGDLRRPGGPIVRGEATFSGDKTEPIIHVFVKRRLGASRPANLPVAVTPAREIGSADSTISEPESGAPLSTAIIHRPKEYGEVEPNLEIELDGNLGYAINTELVASFFEGATRLARDVEGVEYGALHVVNPPLELLEWFEDRPDWSRYYEDVNESTLIPRETVRSLTRPTNVHFIKWLDKPAS